MIRLLFLLAALLVPEAAWAANCSGTAYAHPTGAPPWAWSGANTWATTSTSSAPTACALVAGNAIVFDGNSTTGNYTTSTISVVSIATTGATAGITITGSGGTITITGNTFNVSGVGWSSTTALSFTSTTGTGGTPTAITTGKAAGNTFGNITINGSGGYFEMEDGLNLASTLTFTITAGTVDATTNNPNFNIGFVTGAATLNCGSGTWTLTGVAGSVWNATGTLSCASVNLVWTPASTVTNASTIVAGSNTYGTLTFNGEGGSSAYPLFMTGSPTFTSLTINSNGNPLRLVPSAGATITSTNLTITGTSAYPVGLYTTLGGTYLTTWTITNAPTITYAAIGSMTFTNAATANKSYNLGGNTNLTVNPPTGGGIIGG